VQNALVAVLMLFIQLGVSMMVQDTFFTAWTYLSFALLAVMVRFAREQARGRHTEANAQGTQHAI
jgi:hypothetical protein